MRRRNLPGRLTVTAGALIALCFSATFTSTFAAQAADSPQRISFQIATVSSTGTYFPVGALLSEVLSHPPGVARCESVNACGPAGLIVSTMASQGSVANVISVNAGMISSGLAQADVVSSAMEGRGPFRKTGPTRSLRVIADLYGEDLHLVAATSAKIENVGDLRGKRVSLSLEGSGTILTARTILAAYGLTEKTVRPNYDSPENAADLMREGRLDAFFLVGGTQINLVQELLADGTAHLVPIAGPAITRLLRNEHYLEPHTIPKGAYGNTPAVETLSIDALWVTDESEPDQLIYGMLKALYNPANRPAFQAVRQGSHFIELSLGAKPARAPLHTGALRYFTEAGLIKPEGNVLPVRSQLRKS
jgi:TRAP transporter TAXI family solute receptor